MSESPACKSPEEEVRQGEVRETEVGSERFEHRPGLPAVEGG
jgi:hypothetical protein